MFSEIRMFDVKVSIISPGLVSTELGNQIDHDLGSYYVSDMRNEDMIQVRCSFVTVKVEDIAKAVLYVVKSGPNVNPSEIIIHPQVGSGSR